MYRTLRLIVVTPTDLDGVFYWIGGNDLAVEGSWYWWDGTPVPMDTPFWYPGVSKGNDV